MARTLYALQMIFTIWMLVDAVRRRSDRYWYIVLFFPFGPLVYFFAVKIDDYDLRWLDALVKKERGPSIEALRADAQRTPSFSNQLRLASALHDAGNFVEAVELFRRALEIQPGDAAALFGLGVSHLELADFEEAMGPLAELCDKHAGYRDYEAATAYARALEAVGRDEDAIGVLERVVKSAPRLGNALTFAQLLARAGQAERARGVLSDALRQHESAPVAARWRDRAAAREARDLGASLG